MILFGLDTPVSGFVVEQLSPHQGLSYCICALYSQVPEGSLVQRVWWHANLPRQQYLLQSTHCGSGSLLIVRNISPTSWYRISSRWPMRCCCSSNALDARVRSIRFDYLGLTLSFVASFLCPRLSLWLFDSRGCRCCSSVSGIVCIVSIRGPWKCSTKWRALEVCIEAASY